MYVCTVPDVGAILILLGTIYGILWAKNYYIVIKLSNLAFRLNVLIYLINLYHSVERIQH